MRWPGWVALSTLFVAFVCPACTCSDKHAGAAPVVSATASPTASSSDDDDQDQGTKKRRLAEAMVYIDGEAVAGMRFLELPQKLPVHWLDVGDGRLVRRYRVAEYIELLGADLASVKQVHLIGGRNRHVIIDGAELLRHRNEVTFAFTRSTGGKPNMHFPSGGMNINTQIDLAQAVVVYQKRLPPKYDQLKHYTYFEDGIPIQGIPYATDERVGGTRIYIDGKLVGAIKRKTLPNSIAVPGTTEQGLTRFRLKAYLDHVGIKAETIKGVEFISNDEVAETFDGDTYADRSEELLFSLPKRSRGRIQVLNLPEAKSRLDAILIYQKTELPDRVAQATTPGSLSTQGTGKKTQETGNKGLAQPLHDDARD